VQYGYNSLASGLPLIRDGAIRAIGVTSKERMPQLPDVPSISEYPPLAQYELVNFFGLFAPAGTPDALMEKLHEAVSAALRDPALRAKNEEQGLLVQSMGAEESRRFVAAESDKFRRIVEDAKISVEG
jgi:tripartite-type tricarboxylate transporter receptor subunit TctC